MAFTCNLVRLLEPVALTKTASTEQVPLWTQIVKSEHLECDVFLNSTGNKMLWEELMNMSTKANGCGLNLTAHSKNVLHCDLTILFIGQRLQRPHHPDNRCPCASSCCGARLGGGGGTELAHTLVKLRKTGSKVRHDCCNATVRF
jgi:hypothetical protein